MIINLKQLFTITGESKDISYDIQPGELSDIKGYDFMSPVSISGKLYNRAGIVHLVYEARLTLMMTCDRCLKEYEKSFEFKFEHTVVPSVNSDNDEYIVADGESIEMNDIAVTDILLQLPSKNLCREDCKGLCMVCGCDLNVSQCDCLNN